METSKKSIVDILSRNFDNSLILLDFLKQNSVDYYTYIKKYKDITTTYLDKISKLSLNNTKLDTTQANNLNLVPIKHVLQKVPLLLKSQVDKLKKFLEQIDSIIKSMESASKIDANEINNLKKNFEESKKKCSKNAQKYKKLMELYSNTEKKLIKYYVLLKKNKNKELEEEKNIALSSLDEAKNCAKEYLSSTGSDNYYMAFQEEACQSLNELVDKISNILSQLDNGTTNFYKYFYECYSPLIKIIEDNNNSPINVQKLIDDNISLTFFEEKDYPVPKYKLQVIERQKSEDSKNYKTKNANNIPVLKDKNILEIVKSFSKYPNLIDIGNYNIKDKEEDMHFKKLIDDLILIKKFKKSKIKPEKLTKEQKAEIFELVKKKRNRVIFLQRLNKVRTFGKFEYPKESFDDISKLLLAILEQIEEEEDVKSFELTTILAQTFYYLKNGEKYYFNQDICTHKIFGVEKIWKQLIEHVISIKHESQLNMEEKKRVEKAAEIAFAQIIAIENNMLSFEVDINIIERVMKEYVEKYNLKEEFSQIIMEEIEKKKKEQNPDVGK